MELTIVTRSEDETEALGQRLGAGLAPGDVLALVGDLGAGKTCLARGVARGLGVTEPVTSPTFILIAEYITPQGFPLYHADCYRLGSDPAGEASDIGLAELLGGAGVCIVEWAERIAGLLPSDHLRIDLTASGPDLRRLRFHAAGPRAARILNGQLTIGH